MAATARTHCLGAVLVLCVLVAVVAAPAAARAQSEDRPQLSIRPVGQAEAKFFDIQAAPGDERVLQVALQNLGSQPVRARTYAAAAYTIINGGFGIRLAEEPATGTATWLAYPTEVLDLDPGETVIRDVTLRVPADARAGEHIAGLAIENADPIRGSGGVALDQVVRKAIAVLVTTPGPIEAKLDIVSGGHLLVGERSVVAVALRNPGNVRLRPTGTVAVSDEAGREVARKPVTMDSFYAGTDTRLEVPLDERLAVGRYTIAVSLRDPDHEVDVSVPALTVSVTPEAEPLRGPSAGARVPSAISDLLGEDEQTIPWPVVIGLAVVVILLIATFISRRSRRPVGRHSARRNSESPAPADVPDRATAPAVDPAPDEHRGAP